MDSERELHDFVENGYKTYIPHVSIDCAIFGYHDRQLKLLLINMKAMDGWCLPGGYIKRSEKLVEAAARNVKERTGVDNLYLQQFKTFGDPDRAKFEEFDEEKWFRVTGVRIKPNNWLRDQTISVGYYAITDFSQTMLLTDQMSEKCEWFAIDELPFLEFDHKDIVNEALRALRMQLYHYPIGFNLLPEKFTLSEIHTLYETVLDKKLDISNFPKKLIALGIIRKLTEKRNIGAHRAPHLYSFDKYCYEQALNDGLVLS